MSADGKKEDILETGEKIDGELQVKLGDKFFPISRFAKPHAVVHPADHHSKVDANKFPDVEPEQKQKEDLKKFNQQVLKPDINKPKVDPNSFPDIEPEAKEREAKLEAERLKKSQ